MIKIINYSDSDVEFMNFSGGESFVKFSTKSLSMHVINWLYESDAELMQLGMLIDIIKLQNPHTTILLNIPYFPHARQDRNTAKNQPFSLHVFIKMLASILHDVNHEIIVWDLHSEVASNLLKINGIRFQEITQLEHFTDFFYNYCEKDYDFIVAPDKGAAAKTCSISNKINVPMIVCNKERDPSTGKLSKPSINNKFGPKPEELKDSSVIIIDDICDGGYTFVQLAELLKEHGVKNIDLFVTHGIFSKGLSPFVNYNNIYVCNNISKIEDPKLVKLRSV